ncbi:hypothetical protein M758_UG245700 [Ceratodon purpureus]|nr:hypothetical protein M758_UG245700 [Ceratodon purpureus]
MILDQTKQDLKERAKMMRQLRKESRAMVGEDKKKMVEVDEYNAPNGRGRRELVHHLSVKILSACPTGVFESPTIATATINQIVGEARNQFAGDWTYEWATSVTRASLRQRKYNTKKDFITDRKKVQSRVTKGRYKAFVEASKDSEYVEKSKRLKATRNKVGKVTRAGRGDYTHIKMRYVKKHGEEPTPEKVKEIGDTPAENKKYVE